MQNGEFLNPFTHVKAIKQRPTAAILIKMRSILFL
ncbi:hypothetical protein ELI_1661 [Eubacterium callanderi]|uniref:Uncharacterized protein n=1 Tax=Eubacterium callanderi TaxID=53442 RepID=E3GLM3_9FIRM|nr:hypothetical protein ELI_1661 [Eubacterium callanderi]